MLVDKHVLKMIIETCQILSTTHRVLDGVEHAWNQNGRRVKMWHLYSANEKVFYKATHVNHPCTVWARRSRSNYIWLHDHLYGLLKEYNYRYGKYHECEKLLLPLYAIPENMPVPTHFTEPPAAMDKQYIISSDVVTNYRNYYVHGKKHLHKWTKRQPPEWINMR